MENTRELALDALIEILERGSYSHLVIRELLDKYNYKDSREKAFIKRTVEGTLERMIEIDYILGQFSKTPVPKMKPLIKNLLRMSVYQILFMDGIPDSAVCNEAVKLAGKRGFGGLSGFVNGVLRNIARKKRQIVYPDREKEEEQYLSVKYSMPWWLVNKWLLAYGRDKTIRMLEGLLKEQPITVRIREGIGKREKEDWLLALKDKGIEAKEHPYLPYAFRLQNAEGIRNLPGYAKGMFAVQDVSSMLVGEAAGLKREENLQPSYECGTTGKAGSKSEGQPESGLPEELLALDVCAFPGGKAMHIAEKLTGRGRVIARDISERKAFLMKDNIERMGYKNLEIQVFDASCPDEKLLEQADVVIADLPCSGLGVIGKKRDIKYRINQEAICQLEEMQRQILDVVWRYVKPGGVLIYSTCTVNPGENENMVEWFTRTHPFEKKSLTPYLPKALMDEGAEGTLQLFPGIHETDGFFLARLERV